MEIDIIYREDELVNLLYDKSKERGLNEPRRGYIGMSEIGDPCDRKIRFRLDGLPGKIDARMYRVFQHGHQAEEKIIQELYECGYRIMDRQREFSSLSGRFKGHCDGIIFYRRKWRILEIKTANDASFKKIKIHGCQSNARHYGQVQLYMAFAKLESAVYVVENKNNQELFIERVTANIDEARRLWLKARDILTIKRSETPAKTDNKGICYLCEFKWACESET
jgi:CRISPR/Cas system-associated exonuclease Cas4 (RecB family)